MPLKETRPGAYGGQIIFPMGGDWIVNLLVTHQGRSSLAFLAINVPWQ